VVRLQPWVRQRRQRQRRDPPRIDGQLEHLVTGVGRADDDGSGQATGGDDDGHDGHDGRRTDNDERAADDHHRHDRGADHDSGADHDGSGHHDDRRSDHDAAEAAAAAGHL
jgi:hypothetical protein